MKIIMCIILFSLHTYASYSESVSYHVGTNDIGICEILKITSIYNGEVFVTSVNHRTTFGPDSSLVNALPAHVQARCKAGWNASSRAKFKAVEEANKKNAKSLGAKSN